MAVERHKGQAFELDQAEFQAFRAALRKMAAVAPQEVTQGASKASQRLAEAARARLSSSSSWGSLVAPSVRSSKAREPLIRAGGAGAARAKRSPADQNSYGALLFGAEYGVKSDPRWPGHGWKGSGAGAGYGIWPAVRAESDAVYRLWVNDLVESLTRIWSN